MQGFRSPYRPRREGAVRFGGLLERVAGVDPEMRIRFTSPHPKDFSDDVLEVRAMASFGSVEVLAEVGATWLVPVKCFDKLSSH